MLVSRGLAELRQHRDAARGDVLGRRIEQRAVVGERDVVEVVFEVVDVEGGPAAVAALQALDPLAAARNRLHRSPWLPMPARAVHRHHHHGGVVEIGIVVVVVLERPAARTDIGAFAAQSPLRSSTCLGFSQSRPCSIVSERCLVAAGFRQRVAGQRGVPHRRDAGLAIGLLLADHQQLVDAPCG